MKQRDNQTCKATAIQKYRETDSKTARQGMRQKERHIDIQTKRQTEIQTNKQKYIQHTYGHIDRQDTQTDKETDRH